MLLLPSCEQKETKSETPTEPWLKDEAEREHSEAPSRLRYQLDSGATLSLTLPTRGTKPTGRFSRLRGYAEFNVEELALSRGRIAVELDSLEMDNLPKPDDPSTEQENPELYRDATREALRWLGLGENVAQETRLEHQVAVFEFGSLRSLSHTSAHTGSLRKTAGSGRARQVYATADGELSLRGLAVQRQFPTTLLFVFPDSETKVPDSVEVTLRSGVTVPLSEYEIVPRGPDGHENAKRLGLIGSIVGSQAKIIGTLKFTRSGLSPAGKGHDSP